MESNPKFNEEKFEYAMKGTSPTGAKRRTPYRLTQRRITPVPAPSLVKDTVERYGNAADAMESTPAVEMSDSLAVKGTSRTGPKRRKPYSTTQRRITPVPAPSRVKDTVESRGDVADAMESVPAAEMLDPLAVAFACITADLQQPENVGYDTVDQTPKNNTLEAEISIPQPIVESATSITAEEGFDTKPDEWLNHALKLSINTPNILNYWDLGYFTRLCLVKNLQGDLRIHIRDFNSEKPEDYVIMTPPTFFEFINHLSNFKFVYKISSYIANNQLAVFSNGGLLTLQQIFKMDYYVLPHNRIRLSEPQVKKLQALHEDILQEIMRNIIETILPAKVYQYVGKQCVQCTPNEEIYPIIMGCVKDEFHTSVRKVYECINCIFDEPSQRRHSCSCTMYPIEVLSCSVFEKGLLNMDLKTLALNIAQKLCKHNQFSVLKADEVLTYIACDY